MLNVLTSCSQGAVLHPSRKVPPDSQEVDLATVLV